MTDFERARPDARILPRAALSVGRVCLATGLATWLAFSWVAAAQESAPREWPVPRPELSSMDGVVRGRVQGTQQRLAVLTTEWTEGQPTDEIVATYGELGKLFHAFGLLDAARVCYSTAASVDGTDYRWPHYLGLVLNAGGDLENARTRYEEALDLAPGDFPTLVRLGNVQLELNEIHAAKSTFESARQARPAEAVVYFGLGKVAVADDEPELAIEHFEHSLELQPDAGAPHYPLAQAYRQAGDLESAREHLALRSDEEVRFLDPLGSEVVRLASATSFEIVLSLAREAQDVGEEEFLGFVLGRFGSTEGTIGQLERGLSLEEYSGRASDPRQIARIHYVLGGLLVNAARDDEAIEHFRTAIELDPALVDTRIKLGNAMARAGRFDAAAVEYRGALEVDSESGAARLKLAASFQESGDLASARPVLGELLAQDPGHVEARLRLGEVLEGLGDAPAALEVYRAARDADLVLGEAVELRMRRAQLLRRGSPEAALDDLLWILEADPDHTPAVAAVAGTYGQLGRFGESAEMYSEWVRREPDKAIARVGEATALISGGGYEAARAKLESGIAALPESLVLKDILARHLAACPDPEIRDGARAVALARAVFAALPSAESMETLAMALAEAGDFEEAVALQERILEAVDGTTDPTVGGRLRGNLDLYRQSRACCAQ